MQILVLLGMYFEAVVVFVTGQTLLFRLALAILCTFETNYEVWHHLVTHLRIRLIEFLQTLIELVKNSIPVIKSTLKSGNGPNRVF